MKLKRGFGIFFTMVAFGLVVTNSSITGNVIGNLDSGIKNSLIFVFFVAGLGLLIVEDLEKRINTSDLRNAKQGVPKGEYDGEGAFKVLEETADTNYPVRSEVNAFYVRVLRSTLTPESIPPGKFCCIIPGMSYRNYRLEAYAGEAVVLSGSRAEHKINGRNHVTIYSPDLIKATKGKTNTIRVDVDTLQEVNGYKVPKDLRKFIKKNQSVIKRQVENYFNTGTYLEKL